jgi:hypothetical protein
MRITSARAPGEGYQLGHRRHGETTVHFIEGDTLGKGHRYRHIESHEAALQGLVDDIPDGCDKEFRCKRVRANALGLITDVQLPSGFEKHLESSIAARELRQTSGY